MSMIDRLEARFRYIIFDAPCLRQGSDIYKLGRAVSNTLLVAACRQVRRQTIAHSVSTMRLQGMKVIGTVLNRRVETIPSWLYPICKHTPSLESVPDRAKPYLFAKLAYP